MIDDDRLDEIEARCEAATDGRWLVLSEVLQRIDLNEGFRLVNTQRPENLDFIAHARQDLPALAASIRHTRRGLYDLAQGGIITHGRAAEIAGLTLSEWRVACNRMGG